MIYDITPIGKPRMTRRDKWMKPPRPAVARYFDFKDMVKDAGIEIGSTVDVRFNLPMPKSWSKKKRAQMVGTPHQQKPDIDNLQKALFDAVLDDDSGIYSVTATKYWAEVGSIVIQ